MQNPNSSIFERRISSASSPWNLAPSWLEEAESIDQSLQLFETETVTVEDLDWKMAWIESSLRSLWAWDEVATAGRSDWGKA